MVWKIKKKKNFLRSGSKLKIRGVVEDGEKWLIDRGNEKTVTISSLIAKNKVWGTDHVIIVELWMGGLVDSAPVCYSSILGSNPDISLIS